MTTRIPLALCATALLLLNFPLILIWDRDVTVAGLPLLPVALFCLWAVLIALNAFVAETRRPRLPPRSG